MRVTSFRFVLDLPGQDETWGGRSSPLHTRRRKKQEVFPKPFGGFKRGLAILYSSGQ